MGKEALASAIAEHGLDVVGKYYSVYRGVVLTNDDPLHLNRLKVYIPEIDVIDWALPKGIPGTNKCGARIFTLPVFNEVVYITFEGGNPALPLWEYHGWGERQMPGEFDDPNICGIITPNGTCIILNDQTGEVFIKAKDRLAITAEGPDGVAVSGENIYLSSKKTVQVNRGDQGVIQIKELTNKLNQLVRELEEFKNQYNMHVHPGVMVGPGSSGPTAMVSLKPFSQFVKENYEDKSFLH